MFPRTALAIAALLICAFAAFFIRGAFVAERAACIGGCTRNIAVPYKTLVSRMRGLAESGRNDDLRQLIIKADEHSGDIDSVCMDSRNDSYAIHVHEWTQ
jgi:hypothetical protein